MSENSIGIPSFSQATLALSLAVNWQWRVRLFPALTVWLTGPSWMMGGGRWPLVFRLSLARAELEPVRDTAKHPSQPSSWARTDSAGPGVKTGDIIGAFWLEK